MSSFDALGRCARYGRCVGLLVLLGGAGVAVGDEPGGGGDLLPWTLPVTAALDGDATALDRLEQASLSALERALDAGDGPTAALWLRLAIVDRELYAWANGDMPLDDAAIDRIERLQDDHEALLAALPTPAGAREAASGFAAAAEGYRRDSRRARSLARRPHLAARDGELAARLWRFAELSDALAGHKAAAAAAARHGSAALGAFDWAPYAERARERDALEVDLAAIEGADEDRRRPAVGRLGPEAHAGLARGHPPRPLLPPPVRGEHLDPPGGVAHGRPPGLLPPPPRGRPPSEPRGQ